MIVFRTKDGDGNGLAVRLVRDGKKVWYSPKRVAEMVMLKGIVAGCSTHIPPRADLVVYDTTGFEDEAKRLRRFGTPVIGGNTLETWETERSLGLDIMREGGIRVSDTHAFKTVPQAIRFLEAEGGEWYFKPDGPVPKYFTRKGNADFLIRLLHWARPQLTECPEFVLQAPAPKGQEIDVSVWLNGSDVVAYEVTIEEKKLMSKNKGPALGCSSNIEWGVPDGCKLVKMTIEPFVEDLIASGYVGVAAINTIITPTLEVYGLEWTQRTGWDSTQAWCSMFDETLGDQMIELARGDLAKFDRQSPSGMSLRMSLQPMPSAAAEDKLCERFEGMPLPQRLIDDPTFWPDDIAIGPTGPIMAMGSGYVGTAVTAGRDIKLMRKRLLDAIDALDLPDLMYRTDPVSRLEEVLAFIREHKLAPDPFVGVSKPEAEAA